jgi:hypothetical protein
VLRFDPLGKGLGGRGWRGTGKLGSCPEVAMDGGKESLLGKGEREDRKRSELAIHSKSGFPGGGMNLLSLNGMCRGEVSW